MKIPDGDWKALVLRSLAQGTILAACVVGAMHVAHAWEGRSGVEARSFFTVAGTLAGVPASPMPTLRFTFHKAGETAPCPPIDAVMVTYNGTTFSAQVPYDACGRGYFNGANITVDVAVNGTSVITGQAVNPVPYAQFASIAGTANVATQYGTPDCPVGYERVSDAPGGFPPGDMTPRRLCGRPVQGGVEHVVRVGSGAGAFWIDRFEATVNTQQNAGGTYYFDAPAGAVSIPPAPSSFPPNGQWGALPLATRPFSLSVPGGSGNPPARAITWFQAAEACAASGKVLPSRMQWLLGAQGTQDRGCNLGGEPRLPGGNLDCVSFWGALDMIGNLWEWTDEWYAGAGSSVALDLSSAQPRSGAAVPSLVPTLTNLGGNPWPSGYGDDTTYNVNAFTQRTTDNVSGLPAAAARGGSRSIGNAAGLFALLLIHAPSSSANDLGFRCVIPR
jgi:formylglycine-generating enzyme required for sulfatase activity